MTDNPGLARFILAQENVYSAALSEIKQGRKRTHWMWFIFPQIAGLGFSEMTARFAIHDIHEAKAYLTHPLLGMRLREISGELLKQESSDALKIMGSPDDLKLRSSMTLFQQADKTDPVFTAVLNKFFNGVADEKTLQLLKARK